MFENGWKWPNNNCWNGVPNFHKSYFIKYNRYWAKIFSFLVNYDIQHFDKFWANLEGVKLEGLGHLTRNDPVIIIKLAIYSGLSFPACPDDFSFLFYHCICDIKQTCHFILFFIYLNNLNISRFISSTTQLFRRFVFS